MKTSEAKTVIASHINKLIEEWFSDKPIVKAFAKTALQANINKYDNEFPVSDETINKYYYFGDKLAYELICDYAEEMINDDFFEEDFYPMNPLLLRLKFILKKSLSMPKIIPTVIKSGFSNTSSLHDENIEVIFDKNAKKIKDIVNNR